MQKEHKIQILINSIAGILESGIPLDNATVHYIDSTFASPGAEDLRRILSDDCNCEAETLYELIFFPDLQMQERLEPFLEAYAFDDNDVETAIDRIQQKRIQTRIRFPDGRGVLSVLPPDATVRRLIERLNIARPIHTRIIEALQKAVPEQSDVCRIRVMLRNCRVPISEPFIDALCRCIEIMYPASAYFMPAFAFLLDFLETADPLKEIYAGLIHKKQILGHMILQAENNERALEKTSVEALMLTGMRIPAIHVGEVRKKISLIDHLCLSLYGKTDIIAYNEPMVFPMQFGS
ncbi:MAG: hypothetical protein C4518_11275 [Desulfobacteraceae bacterium]|nr:MAG: hypothetical protein C4518_11275 [Desulfobacteraceae bacterium]